jgi:molecular chaperone GrpE
MADPNGHNENPETAAENAGSKPGEPRVSKPYVMPDDPEEGSVEALTKEVADAKDRVLRTLAEMENLRKRTAKEVADARSYGITAFARDVLDIADNLQRALDAVPIEAREAADPGLKALIEGNGVSKLDPMGEKFDPNFHQAMYEVPDASVASGTVLQVVQSGYTIGERVLRPALVAVAKGGAKAAPAATHDSQA